MSRNILVVGNCQIGGIASALQWLFPDDRVSAQAFNPHVFKGDKDALVQRITAADIVLGGDFVETFMRRKLAPVNQFITLPSLYFNAFHPDIVAAKNKATGERLPLRYNSAICLWAYAHGLDPTRTVGLFNTGTFKALGYLDRWAGSVARMQAAFAAANLDFDRFFCAVKRDGVFMYTMNHPRISLLTWLAKLLALRLGRNETIWRKDIPISDALGRVEIWPVYPEVAHGLAVPGSYTWFVERGRLVESLPDYVAYTFERYASTGVAPQDIEMMGADPAHYDRVLGAAIQEE
ncbi:MAG TPA: WcbI family polysaccharide biosynthesis putative acetyltransferase [Nitrospira sp.]|nr:WcbI family polysaccharide biosynthesis putative acetyltransferase [Nitrospira sp.]